MIYSLKLQKMCSGVEITYTEINDSGHFRMNKRTSIVYMHIYYQASLKHDLAFMDIDGSVYMSALW